MNAPSSPSGAERTGGSAVQIGALVPLTRPGWVDAGRHLLAGLELAVRDVNEAGEITGRLGEAPSFVAFEGYDTIAVLAEMLRSHGTERERAAASWPSVAVEGTRGQIRFSRPPGVSVWQWAWPPLQVVDRDPAEPDRFRVLHTA